MRRTKCLVFLACILLAAQGSYAQKDSTALALSKWAQRSIADGVIWKSVHFMQGELFNANQNINLIEIAPAANGVKLSIGHSDSLETTSQIALAKNALAAINGSFFKMRGADPDYNPALNKVPKREPSNIGKNRSIVYLRENNQAIAENEKDKSVTRKRHLQGTLVINSNQLFMLRADSVDFNWEHGLKASDVISSGPLLLLKGFFQPIPNDAFCNDRHPRTAVGKKADGTIVLFVVDGRANESAGMSIPELQRTMKWLGCTDALNLDGGGSTTMYVKGEPFKGVVNYPTDNKKFDHEGEREVANIILVLKNN
jgi:exopolysaccharide biosynthesis protein